LFVKKIQESMYQVTLLLSHIEIKDPGDVPEPRVRFSFGAVVSLFYYEHIPFFVLSNVLVVFASVAQKGGAEEFIPSSEPDHYCDGLALRDRHLLVEHHIHHLVLNIVLRELCLDLLRCLISYLIPVNALEVCISRLHWVNTKASEENALFGDESNRIESFLIRHVGKLPTRVIYVRKSFPSNGPIAPTFYAEEEVVTLAFRF